MSLATISKKLTPESLKPIYYLYGTEAYLVNQFLMNVHNALFTGEDGELNDVRHLLADTPLTDIIEEAETFPFFSAKKMVVIQDFYLATSQKSSSKIEHDLTILEAYLDQPSEQTVIIVSPYEKLDERKRITKRLKKEVETIDINPLMESDLYKWIDGYLKNNSFVMDSDAKQELYERIGSNLMLIHQELAKCMLYKGDSKHITKEDIVTMVSETIEQSVFAVVEFTAAGQAGQALETYHRLLRQKEEPLAILALLTRQFRIFHQVKLRQEKGYSQKEIASQLKLHPYVVKLASQRLRSFGKDTLKKALVACNETDFSIKTGKVEKERAVELLLIQLSQAT
ncbi:LOW QUALITY PROTEIN: DNA polymerase III delta subunit [Bacillus sp. JCM 19045]|nr:LOW QUALITY PROTEIN: DNA polymerase III delta subunit [Bacillus sp. JCM 19045]